MNQAQFSKILEAQIDRCTQVLAVKANEYSTEDRLHNFRTAAQLQGVTLRQAAAGMMAKHTVSLYDMCANPDPFSAEYWEEKITDHINYLLLLRAIIHEEADHHPPTEDSIPLFSMGA